MKTIFAQIALPTNVPSTPSSNDFTTNLDLAAINGLAQHGQALDLKLGAVDKRVEKLEHKTQHLETGFLAVILLIVVLLLVICMRSAKKGTTRNTSQEGDSSDEGSKAVTSDGSGEKK